MRVYKSTMTHACCIDDAFHSETGHLIRENVDEHVFIHQELIRLWKVAVTYQIFGGEGLKK